jgi:putative phosphoesterase
MRVGVVSDTHLPRFRLPDQLVAGLQGVDLILHLGDFTGDDVPALFEAIAPLEAVAGNNDGPALVRRYGYQKILELAGLRIGLVHGHGSPHPAKWVARRTFEAVDFVCYGHSHIPECTQENGTWYLNPGSPTDKRRMPDVKRQEKLTPLRR